MSTPTLKEKAARGLLWGSVSNGMQQVLNLAFGIVLARTLSRADYGMVGQIAIFSLIAASIQESGFTAALVNRPRLEHRDYNAVFWFALPMSLTLYGLLFACAPLMAAYFHTPELTPLARYVFLAFVISGLGIVPSAWLFKTLRVRERSLANLAALAISGCVSVTLALRGYAYWGIATQTLVYNAINTLLYWALARWRPTLEWDYRPVREMFHFSSRLLATNIISHLNNNFFSIVFGRLYTPIVVGDYNQANKWNYMGHSVVTGVVNGVAQPLFVESRNDPQQQVRVFRKMLRFTSFLSFPVMLGIAAIAREFIVLAIGEKWLESATMLTILCVSGAFLPITALYTQFLLSRGRSSTYMWGLSALVVTQLLTLVVSAPFGILTMLCIYTLINLCWTLVWHAFVRRELGISYVQAGRDILPFLCIAALTMLATHFAVTALHLPLLPTLLAKVAMAALLYPALMWLSGAAIFRESVAFLLKKKSK